MRKELVSQLKISTTYQLRYVTWGFGVLQGKQLICSQLVDFLNLWLLLGFHGEALREHIALALHLHTA